LLLFQFSANLSVEKNVTVYIKNIFMKYVQNFLLTVIDVSVHIIFNVNMYAVHTILEHKFMLDEPPTMY